MRRTMLLAALAVLLQACAGAPPVAPVRVEQQDARAPVTILVSIDAFRPDYMHKGNTPNLDVIAAAGVEGTMRPSFPTLTFPNHEAMITGLRPDRSGMVAGAMFDPRRPGVKFSRTEAAEANNPFWWDGAEPLWVTAEKAHIRTGVMFWAGSEIPHDGILASDWMPFDTSFPGGKRVEKILEWLKRPAAMRPRLVTLYLDIVDQTSHKKGTSAPETVAAVRDVDSWIGELVAGLKAMGQPANLVIVSDHGMSDVRMERVLQVDKILLPGSFRLVQPGPFGAIDPTPGHEAEVEAALLAPHPWVKCWRKADLPKRYHYGTNPRVAAIVCVAQQGGEIVIIPPTNKGDHGYDPDDPDMTALFLVNGPAFDTRAHAPAKFDNVHVYALLRRLIGLPPARNVDASDAMFAKLLKPVRK